MPILIPLLVGEAFVPTILAAQVLLVGSAVWLAFFWLRPLFLTLGEVKAWAVIASVVTVLILVGFAVIVPAWGYLGMAWWWLIIGGLGGHLFALGYLVLGLRWWHFSTVEAT